MLSFLLMLLNGWAACSLANTIAERKKVGVATAWWVHAVGAANVFFFITNAIVFFGS